MACKAQRVGFLLFREVSCRDAILSGRKLPVRGGKDDAPGEDAGFRSESVSDGKRKTLTMPAAEVKTSWMT